MCRLARNEESSRRIDELVLSLNDARELAANEDALQGKRTEGQKPLAPFVHPDFTQELGAGCGARWIATVRLDGLL